MRKEIRNEMKAKVEQAIGVLGKDINEGQTRIKNLINTMLVGVRTKLEEINNRIAKIESRLQEGTEERRGIREEVVDRLDG